MSVDVTFSSKSLNQPLAALGVPVIVSVLAADELLGPDAGDYKYMVTAFNGGESVPTAQTSDFAANGTNGVIVTVEPVIGATHFRLYRSKIDGVGPFDLVVQVEALPVDNTPIIDTGEIIIGQPPVEAGTSNLKSRSMTTSPTKFYECPLANKCLVKEILVSSNNETVTSFSIFFAPDGESPSYGNTLFHEVTIEQNETKILSLNTVLEEGDSIWAAATETGSVIGFGVVNVKISGIEIGSE